MSCAVVSSVSTIPSSPKTSRKTRSSSSCTGTDRLLLAGDVDVRIRHWRLARQVVGPLRRFSALPHLLEAETQEELANEPVLSRRNVPAADLRAPAFSGRLAEPLQRRLLE